MIRSRTFICVYFIHHCGPYNIKKNKRFTVFNSFFYIYVLTLLIENTFTINISTGYPFLRAGRNCVKLKDNLSNFGLYLQNREWKASSCNNAAANNREKNQIDVFFIV